MEEINHSCNSATLKLAKSQVLAPSPQIVSTPPTKTPKFPFHHHPIIVAKIFDPKTIVAKIHQPPHLTPASHRTYEMKENVLDLKFLSKCFGVAVPIDVEKFEAFVAKITAIDKNSLLERPLRKRMRSQETVDVNKIMKTLFHPRRFFKECIYPDTTIFSFFW
jgi:hypothetical protein